ncbi:helix-turn-helix transcriptional regulator [Halarcobacter anaerophilus]|uniref:helix-turn-helix transcriptional regulator n=1 Tax=Halarcobacter anaerophilus TaxID=877500 RepID=UPI0005CA9F41|nr:AlpA family phage regulatory protein [Halarcobacter anaerophilus]
MSTENTEIERFLRIEKVMQYLPFSKGKIYNLIKENKFPKQVKVGANSLWREKDIKKYADELTEKYLKENLIKN